MLGRQMIENLLPTNGILHDAAVMITTSKSPDTSVAICRFCP
jgi:hypothetical protein